MADVLIVIPARMASTRLPGKPLLDIAGEPMIVHVLRRAQAARLGEVVVATDSDVVAACVEKAGGRAVMTRADHVSGSDRIFEALDVADPQRRSAIIVNVQGDLPTLAPADIAAVSPAPRRLPARGRSIITSAFTPFAARRSPVSWRCRLRRSSNAKNSSSCARSKRGCASTPSSSTACRSASTRPRSSSGRVKFSGGGNKARRAHEP